MLAAINDLSFQYQMSSLEEAIERLELFADLCKEVKRGYMTNVERIVIAREGGYSSFLAPNFLLPKIITRIASKDIQRFLISVLNNSDAIPVQENAPSFCLDGKSSHICFYAKDNIVISLLSNPIFESEVLEGTCEEAPLSIHNLSQKGHIDLYEELLGIRHYKAHAVKHKPDRVNTYGKGREASPMDLDDATAQRLLNRALRINNRLYAKYNGKIYAFMEERPRVYHGYIDSEAPEFVKRQLDKIQWDL